VNERNWHELLGRGLSRRQLLRQIAGAGVALSGIALLAACGDDDGDNDDPAPTATQPASASTQPAASPSAAAATQPASPVSSAFPVAIEHKFGTTEIASEPARVVTIGFSEQDAVLALGVTPVAVREWFGEQPYAVWPWAQDALGDGEPTVLTLTFGELDFEAVAALEPDLLIATHSGITETEYGTLAGIAPTLAQSADYPDFGMPWQEQTRSIARALGREEQAEALIAEVDGAIADAAAANPEFAGATIAWASPGGDGTYWAVGPNTPPLRFLSALGFTLSDDLTAAIGDLDSAQISAEQLNLLDADVLIIQASTDEERTLIEEDALFQQLDAVQEGRTVFFIGLEDPVYASLSFSTVLSLPFALDELPSMLAAALQGNGATPTS